MGFSWGVIWINFNPLERRFFSSCVRPGVERSCKIWGGLSWRLVMFVCNCKRCLFERNEVVRQKWKCRFVPSYLYFFKLPLALLGWKVAFDWSATFPSVYLLNLPVTQGLTMFWQKFAGCLVVCSFLCLHLVNYVMDVISTDPCIVAGVTCLKQDGKNYGVGV